MNPRRNNASDWKAAALSFAALVCAAGCVQPAQAERISAAASVAPFAAPTAPDKLVALQVPEEFAVRRMLKEILYELRDIAHYPVPGDLPTVHWVSREQVQQRFCQSGQCTVRALYIPEEGVFLDNTLDPLNDSYDRSIVAHELLHHVQHKSPYFARFPECVRWWEMEREAYMVQNQYLMLHKSLHKVYFPSTKPSCKASS